MQQVPQYCEMLIQSGLPQGHTMAQSPVDSASSSSGLRMAGQAKGMISGKR